MWSEYIDCRFDGSSLRAPWVGYARFVRCSFRGVRLRHWRSQADFIDCVFTGRAQACMFSGVVEGVADDLMTPVRLRAAEFRGNDFSGMELRDVSFRGG